MYDAYSLAARVDNVFYNRQLGNIQDVYHIMYQTSGFILCAMFSNKCCINIWSITNPYMAMSTVTFQDTVRYQFL
jgi:hypothetical protein